MKLKQVLLIIGISAVSAISSVFIYGKIAGRNNVSYVQSTQGKVPFNYAGFFDNAATGNGEPADFTKAASAAVPAAVHIKTKTAAKEAVNQLPPQRSNPMQDPFNSLFNH